VAPGGAGGPAPSVSSPIPVKPVLAGLVDRNVLPPQAYWGSVDNFVIQADWASLQPQAGGPLAVNNPIDQDIAKVRGLERAHPNVHFSLKLRVFGGVDAPDWAKSLGGPPVPVKDPMSGATGTVGRFWTSAYGQAYDTLEQDLAARYDQVPELLQVEMGRCTMFTDEPLIRDAQDPSTVRALEAAGYTTAADLTCQEQQIAAHQVWQQTRSGMAFNPYDVFQGDQVQADDAISLQLMRYCRAALGARCVIENNSLRAPISGLGPQYGPMYQDMYQTGGPRCFQTAIAAKVGSLQQTLNQAISWGASAVELPGGYEQMMTPQGLSSYERQLQTNGALYS
jgi:hypothetical protein